MCACMGGGWVVVVVMVGGGGGGDEKKTKTYGQKFWGRGVKSIQSETSFQNNLRQPTPTPKHARALVTNTSAPHAPTTEPAPHTHTHTHTHKHKHNRPLPPLRPRPRPPRRPARATRSYWSPTGLLQVCAQQRHSPIYLNGFCRSTRPCMQPSQIVSVHCSTMTWSKSTPLSTFSTAGTMMCSLASSTTNASSSSDCRSFIAAARGEFSEC